MIDMTVVKDDQFIQIVIGDFYLVRFDGKIMYDFVGQVVDYDVTLDLQEMTFLRFQAWTIRRNIFVQNRFNIEMVPLLGEIN